MPRTSSPNDDPFADLYGKLPNPRDRGGAALGPRRTASPEPEAEPYPDEAPADAPDAADAAGASPTGPIPAVPTSRRAAREAALAAAGAGAAAPAAAAPDLPAAPVPAASAVLAASEPAQDPRPAAKSTIVPTAASSITTFEEVMAAATGSAPIVASRTAGSAATTDALAPSPADGQSAGLDDLFTGRSSSDDIGHVPPPADKRKRRIGGWIALAVVLLLLGGIAAGGLWVWNTYEDKIREFMGWEEPKDYEEGLATGEALVTIASGDNGSTISQSLYDAGVTKTPEAFYDMLVDTAQNPTFYPGVYSLQQKMTSAAALAALQDPANKLENSALLREGLTVDQTLPIISEGVGIPLEELQAAVADPTAYGVAVDPAIAAAGGQPLEGWLFPAMYTFDPGVTAQQVIQTMVDRTVQSLDAAGVPVEDRQRILTIASIIQREASFEADMQKVSRVIQNRLDSSNQQTFGLLQMDSTAQYGYGEMHDGTVSSSQEALDDPNPWNTYQNSGLPIGPIANPGDVAIDAAMHPADGPWFYFVTVNPDTGETVFTETVQEHERYVAQWQEWCAANPGKC
jgi:UPF0755 protein